MITKTDLLELLTEVGFSAESQKKVEEIVAKYEDLDKLELADKKAINVVVDEEMMKGNVKVEKMDDLIMAMESFASEISEEEAKEATDLSTVDEVVGK